MNKTLSFLSGISLSLIASSDFSHAKIINLADQEFTTNSGATIEETTYEHNNFIWHAGALNGAIFRRAEASDDTNSGSGVFRDLYSLQDSPVEQGYNRPIKQVWDSSVLGGTSHLLTLGDLKPDASGNFFVFTVDANEKNNATERFISLDEFQIYVEDDAQLGVDNNLPGSVGNLGDLGDKVYDMDLGNHGESTVLMDYSTSNGSGSFDMFVYVPVSAFADHTDPNAYIYLYTEFGGYTDSPTSFIADAGGEQIAAYTDFSGDGTPPLLEVPPSILPEPHSAMLAAAGGLMMLLRRKRE